MVKLAVDVMGGDFGPSVTLAACLAFLTKHPSAGLVLVGLPSALSTQPLMAELQAHPRCQFVAASEVVAMDDPLEVALRRKKDSSMRLAIKQVKEGAAQAAISAGNTGALMAIARYVLKTMPGIDRPAIAAQLPNAQEGATTVLDLGANVDCTPEHLLQFAIMGSALVCSVSDKTNPSVGLLNVGAEAIKGSETIKQAGKLLSEMQKEGGFNFYGNVEGDDIFKGAVDIVVCDGFVGNVALKASEGLAAMVSRSIRSEFSRTGWTRLAALIAAPVLRCVKQRMDHRRYNGAALLGLQGLVFKSHGSADAFAFECALNRAHDAVLHGLQTRLHNGINQFNGHHFGDGECVGTLGGDGV